VNWNMKLFEEIARSLRLVKGVHQPEVLEPETPASASEFEIIVPSDAAARHAGFSPELRDTIRVIRHDVLATLRQVPAFVSAAQKMASEGCLYRVLVSEEHVDLLREGADGIVNPFLRDAQGRFVENVDLIRVPPDFAGAIAAIAINAALADHPSPLTADSTRRSAFSLTLLSTRTRTPSGRSISITPTRSAKARPVPRGHTAPVVIGIIGPWPDASATTPT
jgi:hypothetical protein